MGCHAFLRTEKYW